MLAITEKNYLYFQSGSDRFGILENSVFEQFYNKKAIFNNIPV